MSHPIVVTTASGMTLNAQKRGKARLPLVYGGACTLENVLYVPGLQRNLVSLSKVGAAGLTANFGQDRCVITSGDSQLVAARSDNGLYIVTSPASSTWVEANTALRERDLGLWHARLCHLNARDLKKALRSSGVGPVSSELAPCDACTAGKVANVSFPAKKARSLKSGQVLIAIDYVGPMETASQDGYTGMMTIMIEPFH
ncbi:hypothetical protein PR003_g19974 [Phytophthora rubi]|nr:hypothetical protein PR003_g19974 [Phytophthora rubi]